LFTSLFVVVVVVCLVVNELHFIFLFSPFSHFFLFNSYFFLTGVVVCELFGVCGAEIEFELLVPVVKNFPSHPDCLSDCLDLIDCNSSGEN